MIGLLDSGYVKLLGHAYAMDIFASIPCSDVKAGTSIISGYTAYTARQG